MDFVWLGSCEKSKELWFITLKFGLELLGAVGLSFTFPISASALDCEENGVYLLALPPPPLHQHMCVLTHSVR